VFVIAVVTTLVLLNRAPSTGVAVPTPTFAATAAPPAPTTTPVASVSAVAVAAEITHPATADVAHVLDAYVAGINDRRYSDAFALFSPDNATARKGLDAWEAAESTTQIREARLLSVRDAATGSVSAEMTFTSTQDARFGPDGQTCSQWDLVYDMSGPGPNWQIHRVSTRADPKPC
jgi:serine protease Do